MISEERTWDPIQYVSVGFKIPLKNAVLRGKMLCSKLAGHSEDGG
jgi:hypothetical protein